MLQAAKTPAEPISIVRKASTLGQRALAQSLKELGAKESPANSNKNKFGKWFGVDGVAWCNIFVSYCFVEGAEYTIHWAFEAVKIQPPEVSNPAPLRPVNRARSSTRLPNGS